MEKGPRILVVDDETPIRRYLRVALSAQGYDVYEASNGQEALTHVLADRPDLIILDLGLPDLDGTEVTRRLREWSQTPILVLSVREGENDKVGALDAGADDYLTKPFGTGELMARIRAALRRLDHPAGEPELRIGRLRMDLPQHRMTADGEEIQLTPTEFDLLKILMQNAGKVLTHHQLLRAVWGTAYENEIHLLRVNISNIRGKIELDSTRPQYLLTEPGVGYRLKIFD